MRGTALTKFVDAACANYPLGCPVFACRTNRMPPIFKMRWRTADLGFCRSRRRLDAHTLELPVVSAFLPPENGATMVKANARRFDADLGRSGGGKMLAAPGDGQTMQG